MLSFSGFCEFNFVLEKVVYTNKNEQVKHSAS